MPNEGSEVEWGITREVERLAGAVDKIVDKVDKLGERTNANETAVTLLKFQVFMIGVATSMIVTPIVAFVVTRMMQ